LSFVNSAVFFSVYFDIITLLYFFVY